MRLFLNIACFGHENGRMVAMFIGPNAYKPHTAANLERVERIHRYLSGGYTPAGLLDVEYNGRAG